MSFPQLFRDQSVVYNVATMAMESDLDLMLRVRAGDAASFETLLRRYRLPLVSFFHRMVRDQALAEDLAQEAFLRIYKARERYQPEARFTTWLYRIATNLALNAICDRKDGFLSPRAEILMAGLPSKGSSTLSRRLSKSCSRATVNA